MAEQALATEDTIEIEITPEDSLEVVDAVVPAAEAPAAPAAAEPDRGNLGAALKEERSKKARLAEDWRKAEAEATRLREQLRSKLDEAPSEATARVRATAKASAEKIAGIGAHIRTKGGQVTDLEQFAAQVGQAHEAVAAEILATGEATAKAIEAAEQRAAANLVRERTAAQEREFKKDHKDYEKVLAEAGIFDACQMIPDGKGGKVWKNPALAEEIYSHPNPPQRAYELAMGKQIAEAEDRGQTLTDVPDAEEPARPAARPAARVAVPGDAESEAERRGAARVIEQVSANTTRQRGLRAVPATAGNTGTRTIDRPYLDKLLDENPEGYQRLIERHPNLKTFHLGGF